MKNSDWILVVSLGVIWGASFFFNEVLLKTFSPFMIVYLRVAIAALFLLAVVLTKKQHFKLTMENILNLSVMALLNNVIPFSLITYGQESITGGLASILNANTAFATIILASLMLPNERLVAHRLVGVVIGIFGVICAVGYENILQFGHDGIGKYLVICASISYAFASVWGKKRLHHLSPMISATGMLTMSTLILSPYVLTVHGEELLLLDFVTSYYAVGLGVLCSGIAYLLFFRILESSGAGNVMISTLIIPPAAIFLNSMMLEQTVTMVEFYGLMIISVGLLIIDGRMAIHLKSLFKLTRWKI